MLFKELTIVSSRKMFENMNETAGSFESKPNSKVHHDGANIISVRCSGRNTRRLTGCVSFCSDVTRLPLFFIFKGEPNGHIEETSTQSYQNEFILLWVKILDASLWRHTGLTMKICSIIGPALTPQTRKFCQLTKFDWHVFLISLLLGTPVFYNHGTRVWKNLSNVIQKRTHDMGINKISPHEQQC